MGKKILVEGLDYYFEEKDGIKFKVFTEYYLSNREFCCKNSCRHCPYGFNKNKKNETNQLGEF